MRSQPAENRNQPQQDVFEIEEERHCDLRLVYHVPADELVIILQPARRRQVSRTVTSQLTLDFDEDGLLIGMQLVGTLHPTHAAFELDIARALRPFKACDNVALEEQVGYVHVRAWEPFGEEDVAYVVETDAHFDLGHDGGLLAVRFPRTARDYELDPFSAFMGLPWKAEVDGGGALSQFGLL